MDHKEAIERIKARFNKWALDDKDLDAIKTIVPELHESKDERMLRIIENVICTNEGEVIAQKYGLKLTDLADWLEKIKEPHYSPLCNTIKDKIREYIANHFIADTVVKTDMKSIVKVMEEGVRLGMKEQKPVEWSEEDEYCRNQLIVFCENCMQQDSAAIRCANWLKTLPERFNLQPNKEWSEKDEDMLNSIIATCQLAAQDRDSGPARHLLEMQEKFLESFRSRPKSSDNWKPSEEQMAVLSDVKNDCVGNQYEIIDSLWIDLKNYFNL